MIEVHKIQAGKCVVGKCPRGEMSVPRLSVCLSVCMSLCLSLCMSNFHYVCQQSMLTSSVGLGLRKQTFSAVFIFPTYHKTRNQKHIKYIEFKISLTMKRCEVTRSKSSWFFWKPIKNGLQWRSSSYRSILHLGWLSITFITLQHIVQPVTLWHHWHSSVTSQDN